MSETEKPVGTLIKTFVGSRTNSNNNVYDTLLVVYRDKDGNKKTRFYDRPEMTYYTLKDKDSEDAIHPPMYIQMDKLEKHTTYSDNLYRDIAINTGALSFYDKVNFNYNKWEKKANLKNLFKSPLLYNADMDLEDQYIAKFYREFDPDPKYKIRKTYLDIETDLMPDGNPKSFTGFPNPKEAPCPICLITVIDDFNKQSHTFILRNKLNKALTDFEKNDVESFCKEMHEELLHDKINDKEEPIDLKINLYFYDTELELIKGCFDKLHEIDPDYCGIWNNSFDIQTIQNRLIKLYRKDPETKAMGVRPEQRATDALCDMKYSVQKNATGNTVYLTPQAYFSEGHGKIGRKYNTFGILDGIYWVDQMLIYALIHVSEGKLDSYSLNSVADHVVSSEKLPFAPGETYKNILWKNPRKYIKYNIKDVLLLYKIENATGDIDTLQNLSAMTCTKKDKVFSKSISLTNFVNKYALNMNLAMRTNKNSSYGRESWYYMTNFMPVTQVKEFDKKYADIFDKKDKYGAYVSDPTLNDNVGMEIFSGKNSKFLYELVCDMDFSSLYPSIIRAFNLDPMNIIGKFYCIDGETKKMLKDKYNAGDMFKLSNKDKAGEDDADDDEPEETSDDQIDDIVEEKSDAGETDDIGSVLTDAITSQDWVELGKMFFDLPSVDQVINDLIKR